MATTVTATTRAAYDPVWTPAQFNFPVAQKFISNKRPAPLNLSGTLRPRRSRSSPAVSRFTVDPAEKNEKDAVATARRPERIAEEKTTTFVMSPTQGGTIGEIVVGLGIPATLKSNSSSSDLSEPPDSAKSSATTMSNMSDATSIMTLSSVSSLQSNRSRRKAEMANVAALEEILDIARMSPHYVPNIRGGLSSPVVGMAMPLPSPSATSIRSNNSGMSRGPLSGNSSKTVMGLPSSPKPKRGALSPNFSNSALTSPNLSVTSGGRSPLRSPASSFAPSLASPAMSTASSLAAPAAEAFTATRTPPPPPYTRSPKLSQHPAHKGSFSRSLPRPDHNRKPMYAHSNTSEVSTNYTTQHTAEWDAVETLLRQIRLQQKQLEELQRAYESRVATIEAPPPQAQLHPIDREQPIDRDSCSSAGCTSVSDSDTSGVMTFQFGFDGTRSPTQMQTQTQDPLQRERDHMNCTSPKQLRARALTTSAAGAMGPESPVLYFPQSPVTPLHVPPVHQVFTAPTPMDSAAERDGQGGMGKFWQGARRLAGSRSRTPRAASRSGAEAGHQRHLSYEAPKGFV